MAEHAGSERQQVDKDEGAQRWRMRQQQIQHHRCGGDVQRGDHQLDQRQLQVRQAQGTTTETNQNIVRDILFRQATTVDEHRQQQTADQHRGSDYSQHIDRKLECQ